MHPEAIVRVNGGRIGPGETLRGDVLFDITEADYQELQRRGRFFIWNFGDRASPQLARGAQVGQIRLYAGEPEAPPQQQQQRLTRWTARVRWDEARQASHPASEEASRCPD